MDPRTPIRHGEVLLLPVPAVPEGTTTWVNACIVGHSESGHHHVVECDAVFAEIIAANGDLYVDLDSPSRLSHRKSHHQHRQLTVPPGAWRVMKKTEFDVSRLSASAPEPPIHPKAIPDADFRDEGWEQRAMRRVKD